MRIRPTRFYSDRQEKHIAKATGGKQTANSGATAFSKGDVRTQEFLIEAKTVTKPQTLFTIKKEWIDKNREEAFAMNKSYQALAFNFGPDEEMFYVVDEKLFKKLLNYLEGG